MSFTSEKRDAIKKYLLEKIRMDDPAAVSKTVENFAISATTVQRYMQDFLQENIVEKSEEKSCGYELVTKIQEWTFVNDGLLEEDTIYYDTIKPYLEDVSDNAQNIWEYCFAEIMNNAIEHSGGDKIQCCLCRDYLYTEISIRDNGIGIFRNICKYFHDKKIPMKEEQAAMELYKGKLTTDATGHSGEGIFFTSKCLESMAIWSDDIVYRYHCSEEDTMVQSHLVKYYTQFYEIGTLAIMRLENDTMRTTKEIFDIFAPIEEGFIKTLIPIKEMCPFGNPVARSQARRILRRLEDFQEIIFDFRDVEILGQGFADEVFRVFQNRYPEIVLTVQNANKSVQGMIRHVSGGRNKTYPL